MTKIKYVGIEKEKKVESSKGRVYTFTMPDKKYPERPVVDTIDISEPTLCKHLVEKCNHRFVKVDKK